MRRDLGLPQAHDAIQTCTDRKYPQIFPAFLVSYKDPESPKLVIDTATPSLKDPYAQPATVARLLSHQKNHERRQADCAVDGRERIGPVA